MFSVIIPLFNKVNYIEKAIISVLRQTFHNFELIILDDGSTDESVDVAYTIINNYPVEVQRKISVISQENKGVSSARNYGVELATFDYITFLDADDWWCDDYLERMKFLIDNYPVAGIYGCSYYKVRNGKSIDAKIGVNYNFDHGIINYFKVYSLTLWMPLTSISTVVKKSVFCDIGGFNSKLKLGEDFDLWARIASRYPVAYLNVPLAYYDQDVDVATRAVGARLYEPEEHMLFTTYDEELTSNPDFVYLFERLALYGLLPYYLNNKNTEQVQSILGKINWSRHELKYSLYYKYLPKVLVNFWFSVLKAGSGIKRSLIKTMK